MDNADNAQLIGYYVLAWGVGFGAGVLHRFIHRVLESAAE